MNRSNTYIVISTCLTSETACKCLIECVSFVHRYYSNILIINDTPQDGIDIYQLEFPCKVKIIRNEFNKSGELTRIYYFWKYCKETDYGILIHDSTFINSSIYISKTFDYIPLFSFEHKWNNTIEERKLIKNYTNLLKIYDNKDIWKGTFGIQYIVSWQFINKVMFQYNDLFEYLLETVKTRTLRSCCERVIQVIFQSVSNKYINPLFNTIHNYTAKYCGTSFGFLYETYIKNKAYYIKHMPIIKIWLGR